MSGDFHLDLCYPWENLHYVISNTEHWHDSSKAGHKLNVWFSFTSRVNVSSMP